MIKEKGEGAPKTVSLEFPAVCVYMNDGKESGSPVAVFSYPMVKLSAGRTKQIFLWAFPDGRLVQHTICTTQGLLQYIPDRVVGLNPTWIAHTVADVDNTKGRKMIRLEYNRLKLEQIDVMLD